MATAYPVDCSRLVKLTVPLDALVSFAPAHARALAARALTLKELDRLDEALETARRAALAAP
jgi:hypothetical protein